MCEGAHAADCCSAYGDVDIVKSGSLLSKLVTKGQKGAKFENRKGRKRTVKEDMSKGGYNQSAKNKQILFFDGFVCKCEIEVTETSVNTAYILPKCKTKTAKKIWSSPSQFGRKNEMKKLSCERRF